MAQSSIFSRVRRWRYLGRAATLSAQLANGREPNLHPCYQCATLPYRPFIARPRPNVAAYPLQIPKQISLMCLLTDRNERQKKFTLFLLIQNVSQLIIAAINRRRTALVHSPTPAAFCQRLPFSKPGTLANGRMGSSAKRDAVGPRTSETGESCRSSHLLGMPAKSHNRVVVPSKKRPLPMFNCRFLFPVCSPPPLWWNDAEKMFDLRGDGKIV